MTETQLIELTPAPHPDPRVHRAGFGLTDPYVEQCWGAVAGPSTVLLLRRLPILWAERAPALLHGEDLGLMLGLGPGTTPNSRLARTLERTVRFHLAEWEEPGRSLRVFTEAAPLSPGQLERAPAWTRQAHDRLLDAHLDRLRSDPVQPTRAAELVERLDRLQHRVEARASSVPAIPR